MLGTWLPLLKRQAARHPHYLATFISRPYLATMAKASPHNSRIDCVEPMPPDEAKWIRLNKIKFTDPSGKARIWESAERRTRPKNSDCDAVGVVAILEDPRSSGGPSILLQKQFRPPVDRVCIEVPSGLIDEGESPMQAAIREFKEETGYVATPYEGDDAGESFTMFNDPGFCNTNTKMIFVKVDMADPRNQNPRPELEENEYIECFTLPLATMWKDLAALDKEGYAVDARVGTLAQGIEIARRWKSNPK